MKKENIHSSFKDWLEDIWEEIETQLFGIIGAIIFFTLIFLIFKPSWMIPIKNIQFLSS